jgi:hypothetical protein
MLVLVEEPAGVVRERRAGPLHALLTRLLGAGLDRRLADGARPDSSVLLSLRAARLVSLEHRTSVADELHALLERSLGAPSGPGAWVVDWSGVRRSRWELAELAAVLGDPGLPEPRGVALAEQLLRDGAGPLYYPDETHALARAARHATIELDPHGARSRT